MIEIIVVGFAVVLMVLPVFGTVARLSEEHANVHAAARDGAAWIARHGGDPPEADGIKLSVIRDIGSVEVIATRDVNLVGVMGATVERTVRATVTIRISQYRSMR